MRGPSPYAGPALTIDATVTQLDSEGPVRLSALVTPLTGGAGIKVRLGELVPGRHSYQGTVTGCGDGCRVARLDLGEGGGTAVTLRAVLHTISQPAPAGVVVGGPAAGGSGSGIPGWHWHAPAATDATRTAEVSAAPDGMAVSLSAQTGQADGRLLPDDTPYPLPVVSTAPVSGGTISGLGRASQPVRRAAAVRALPRLGGSGVLADLEYSNRLADDSGASADPQVWLSAHAPPDLPDRLEAAGLTVTARHDLRTGVALLDHQGPAVGLRFHLLAVLLAVAMAIGAFAVVAAVDREGGAADLRALRRQGIRQRVVTRAGLYAYLALALLAVALGTVAGLLAFAVAGVALPVSADGWHVLATPRWPTVPAVLLPWALTVLVMLVVGVAAALGLRHDVTRRGLPGPDRAGDG